LFVRVIIALIAIIVLFIGACLGEVETPDASEDGATIRGPHRVDESVGLPADLASASGHVERQQIQSSVYCVACTMRIEMAAKV
jgi:hypothetical protein